MFKFHKPVKKLVNGVEQWCYSPQSLHHDGFIKRVVAGPTDVVLGGVSGVMWGLNTVIPGQKASKRAKNWRTMTSTAVRNAAHCVHPGKVRSARVRSAGGGKLAAAKRAQ